MAVGPIDGIEREPVDSSNIRAIGYSGDTLAIEFKSGDVFHYAPVPLELATEFYAAESKGRFYSAQIKYKIPSKLMTGPCNKCQELGVIGEACSSCRQGTHFERERRRLTQTEKAIEAREINR